MPRRTLDRVSELKLAIAANQWASAANRNPILKRQCETRIAAAEAELLKLGVIVEVKPAPPPISTTIPGWEWLDK